MADAVDSKSTDRKVMWVQVPPRAQIKNYPKGVFVFSDVVLEGHGGSEGRFCT